MSTGSKHRIGRALCEQHSPGPVVKTPTVNTKKPPKKSKMQSIFNGNQNNNFRTCEMLETAAQCSLALTGSAARTAAHHNFWQDRAK